MLRNGNKEDPCLGAYALLGKAKPEKRAIRQRRKARGQPPGQQTHTVAGDGTSGAGPTACFSVLPHTPTNTPCLRAISLHGVNRGLLSSLGAWKVPDAKIKL